MELCFISRSEYRALRERNWQIGDELVQNIPTHPIILPEGGAGGHTIEGCAEIWYEIKKNAHQTISSFHRELGQRFLAFYRQCHKMRKQGFMLSVRFVGQSMK